MPDDFSCLDTSLWFISRILLDSAHETSIVFLMPWPTEGRMSSWFPWLCRNRGFDTHSGSLRVLAERLQITFLLERSGSAASTFPRIEFRGPRQILIFIESEFVVAVKMYDQRLVLRSYHILHVFLCHNLRLAWTVFVANSLEILFREIFFHLHDFQFIRCFHRIYPTALWAISAALLTHRIVDIIPSLTQAPIIHVQSIWHIFHTSSHFPIFFVFSLRFEIAIPGPTGILTPV